MELRSIRANRSKKLTAMRSKCEHGVESPEGERVGEGALYFGLPSAIRDHVQIALRICRREIGRRGQDALSQGHNGGHGFERSSGAQRVTVHGFGRTNREPICM